MKFLKYLAAIWLTLSFVACGGGGGAPGLPSGATTPLITTAPSSLTLGVNAVNEYRISGGRAPYQVSSSNEQVSVASVSNASLTITGVASGAANIVVSDASGQTTVLAVSVQNIFALYTTAPSSFTIAKDTQRMFTVSGGVPGYVAESTDARIVAVTLSGSALNIRGVAAGSASVLIRDKANSLVTISVTVGGDSPLGLFTSAPAVLTVATGSQSTYSVGGGVPGYSVESSDRRIATVSLSGNSMVISAVALGATTITIRDSAGSTLSVGLTVASSTPGTFYTTAPSALSMGLGSSLSYSVSGGAQPYSVVSSDTRVVTGSVSGTTLSISSFNAGSAALQITDATGSVLQIVVTVSPNTFFTTAPSALSMGLGSSLSYSVSGGVQPYSVASSDTRVVTGSVSGTKLTISSFNAGSAALQITDATGSVLQIAVKVSTTTFFTSAPSALFMGSGTSLSFSVSGGAQPYSAVSADTRVVNGSISGSALSISAFKAGSAILQITDALGSVLQIAVTVDGTTGGTGGPAAIEILPSSNTLPSAAGNKVTFVVTVKDSVNTAIPNQVVTFTSSSGILSGANPAPKTDANGTISSVSLSPGSDQSNRTITVTATAGAISKSINIPVVGTAVSISGPGSTLIGAPPVAYTAKAVDSAGNPIAGASLTVVSAKGNTLTPSSLTTDLAGAASFNLTPSVAGADTLTLTGLGASAVTSVAVSNEDFSFTSPLAAANLVVNTQNVVTVRYRVGGVGVAGQSVTFSTTRGVLTSTTVTTDANGNASTTISSTTAGPVTLSAQLGTARSNVTAAFIATVPASIVLQANPNALPPNTGGGSTNQSTLSTTVRDATGNPVSGKVVNFTAIQDGSNGSIVPGSGTTDANGMTSVQFIPGALSTSANGVKLRATVQSAPSIFADATLTVNGDALFISIGVGSTLTVLDPVTYEKDFSVYVTDANGVAAAGRSVTISAYPPTYRKGYLERVGGRWIYFGTPTTCANEDVNRSGILDGGEDVNGNGILDPGLPVVLFPASLTTDATGTATFKMRYGKNYALWLTTQVSARSLVGGTESSKTVTYDLEMLFEDATNPGSPANVTSPFGISTLCTNPN